MSDFSNYTHKWRAVPNTSNETNKVSKRNRQPVSCQPCRTRKLKCDRGHPCEACLKRSDEDSCHYGKSTSSSNTANQNSHSKSSPGGRAQDRLRQLEDLVRQMIDPATTDQPIPNSHVSQIDETSAEEGPLNRDRHGTHYTGSTHWSAILDQIQDLRTLISIDGSPGSHTDSSVSPFASNSTQYSDHDGPVKCHEIALFTARQPQSLSQILTKYLPPRQNVNRLLSIFFNEKFIPTPYIHTQQFEREYDEFWKDPHGSKTSPMWLSMLFSILSMGDKIRLAIKVEFETGMLDQAHQQASNGTDRSSESRSPESDRAIPGASPDGNDSKVALNSLDYLSASAQLLVLGDYTRPQPHLVEALCLHNQVKYSLSLDPNRETALIQSILVRQAYSMSYHRDCTNFPPGQFSVFEAEIRRRCWAAIKQMDLMISFQLGIPMNVADASWDTKPPRNLLDTDFDEDSTVLPEPRGDGEPTQMLYFVYKTGLMDVYAKILRHTLSFPQSDDAKTSEDTRATVMNLDAEMRKISERLPTVMKVKPMSLSFSDPSWLIMLRTNLMFVVQKSLCVLHRKHMLPDPKKANGDATYSRKVVVDASSKIVNHFLDLHMEFQPGGQLSRDWWMLGAFTVNDFLLAVMLLCFAFWMERKKNVRRGSNDSRGDVLKWLERDDEARSIFEALGKAKCVCEIYGKTSSESKRVAEVLWVVLEKFASNDDQADPTKPRGQGNYMNMTGGMVAASPFGQQSQSDHDERDRIDFTPLSINDRSSSTSLGGANHISPSSNSNQMSSSGSDHEATWTMVDAIPYKKPTTKSQPQPNATNSKQQPQNPLQNSPYQPNINSQGISPANGRSTSTVPATTNPPPMTAPALDLDNDPFASLLDTTDESIDMDWATFDQILGNFNSGAINYGNGFGSDGFIAENPPLMPFQPVEFKQPPLQAMGNLHAGKMMIDDPMNGFQGAGLADW